MIELTFSIPTFNRAHFLSECLNSLVISIENARTQNIVEIIVCDNASEDCTSTIVESFISRYSYIRYYRNEKNIGGMKNFYKVAELACGKYVCLIGDDDKVLPETVEQILSFIKQDYDIILSNYSIWDKSFHTKIKNKILDVNYNKHFVGRNVILKNFSAQLGYISIVFFKKDIFFKLPFERYIESEEFGFCHLHAILYGLTDHSRMLVTNIPYIQNRSGNSNPYDWAKYFITGTHFIFNDLLRNGYKFNAVIGANNFIITKYIIYFIVESKRRNMNNSWKLFKLMLKYYFLCYKFWFVALPMLIIPKLFFKLSYINTFRKVKIN